MRSERQIFAAHMATIQYWGDFVDPTFAELTQLAQERGLQVEIGGASLTQDLGRDGGPRAGAGLPRSAGPQPPRAGIGCPRGNPPVSQYPDPLQHNLAGHLRSPPAATKGRFKAGHDRIKIATHAVVIARTSLPPLPPATRRRSRPRLRGTATPMCFEAARAISASMVRASRVIIIPRVRSVGWTR